MNCSNRFAMLALVVGFASIANAQQPDLIEKLTERKATPLSYTMIEGGRIQGWKPYVSAGEDARDLTWAKGFDTLNWNLADTGAAGHNANVYGVAPAGTLNWTITVGGQNQWYNVPFIVDDMKVAPGSEGSFAKRFRLRWMWSPTIATYPSVAGSAPCYILIGMASGVNTSDGGGNPLTQGPAFFDPYTLYAYNIGGNVQVTNGILINFGTSAGGTFFWDGSLTGPNDGLPLPNGTGGLIMAALTTDANNNLTVLPSTGVAQFRYTVNCSPTSINYVGTNPSDSDQYVWEDSARVQGGSLVYGADGSMTGGPDLATSELSDDLVTISGQQRRYHPGVGLAFDQDQAYMDVQLNFGSTPVLSSVYYNVVAVDANGTPIPDGASVLNDFQSVPVLTGDKLKVLKPVLNDPLEGETTRFKVSLDLGKPYIRRNSAVWNVASPTTLTLDIYSGDADGDESITVFDYGILSDYFDKTNADTDWETVGTNGAAPVDADFDFDGSVTVFGYGILSEGFDQTADPDLIP